MKAKTSDAQKKKTEGQTHIHKAQLAVGENLKKVVEARVGLWMGLPHHNEGPIESHRGDKGGHKACKERVRSRGKKGIEGLGAEIT